MHTKAMLKAMSVAILFLCAGCASLASAFAPNVNTDPTALRAGNYALDPAHASLIFKIDHLGFSTYVGRFNIFDISLDFDEENAAAARVEASVDMTSLDVANDDFANTLMGPNWFDANTFPEALFQSTAITITGDNRGQMTGDLTLHGVTQPVTLDVIFNGGGSDRLRGAYVVGLSATARISRRAFGVDRFDGIVGDQVDIEIEAEFLRQ